MQQANSNRMFSLEVRLENNLTRTNPTIENSVCKSSLSVINNGVTFITEIYGVLPIIRRETHFARNKSVCERSDGCCGLHSQLHRLLWAYTDAPRRTRINLDDLRRLVEVICTTLNIRLFLLWLPYFFLGPFITVTRKTYWEAMNSEVFFELKQKINETNLSRKTMQTHHDVTWKGNKVVNVELVLFRDVNNNKQPYNWKSYIGWLWNVGWCRRDYSCYTFLRKCN